MIYSDNVPTVFAISLAKTAGIVVAPEVGRNHKEYQDKIEKLKAFQQIAVTSSFEDSLIAFHGEEISEGQKAALEIIYKSTRPWMLGHVVGVLLNKLDTGMNNKDFAESVRTIVEQLTDSGKGKDDESTPTNGLKGLLVKLTGVKEENLCAAHQKKII